MPGLFGYFRRKGSEAVQVEDCLDRMVASVQTRHPCRISRFADSHCAVYNARFPESSTEVEECNKSRRYRVFFDGFLLNRREIAEELRREGVAAEGGWDDQTLVEWLFDFRDEEVVEILRGSFNICAYDLRRPRVKLLNCRHGARHLYYRSTPEFFAFATEMKGLIELGDQKGKINWLAIQDMFNFGYISGAQTFFEDVHLLEPGSVLTVDCEGENRRRYWSYPYQNEEKGEAFEKLVDEGAELLDRAVGRLLGRFGRVGVPLSGGLDSRTILAFASRYRESLETFHCAWYEQEEEIARELCQRGGGIWNRYDPLEFDPAWMVREGMEISDGNVHCHQFWFLPVIQEIGRRDLVDVLLDGYLMDVFFGDTFLVLPRKERYADAEKIEIINGIWRRCRPIFVEKAFLPGFYRDYQEANRVSIEAGMSGIEEGNITNFIQAFSLANRSNRYSVALPNVQRQYVEYAYPGLDYDLTDFYLRLPPEHKREARFYREILQRHCQRFAEVPWAKTGKPLGEEKSWIDRLRGSRFPVHQLGRLALLGLSGGRIDLSHRGDLNRHFRRDVRFRTFFTEILEDPRTLSRGIIDRKGVEQLIHFVDRGWPVLTLIQSLITVELWFRRFIDE